MCKNLYLCKKSGDRLVGDATRQARRAAIVTVWGKGRILDDAGEILKSSQVSSIWLERV